MHHTLMAESGEEEPPMIREYDKDGNILEAR
jgi:hypothetical protein